MRTPLSIAIIGAGVAGLSSALFLNRHGHDVTLYEKFGAAKPVGSGLLLQPTGLTVLDQLGLYDAIRALGNPINRLSGRDALSGKKVLDVRYRPKHGEGVAFHRSALFDVLYNSVVDAAIPIELNTPVDRVTTQDERALLYCGDTLVGSHDLVVDCSGSTSVLKGPSPVPRRILEYGALWTSVDWVDIGLDQAALHQRYRRASVMIGVLPVGQQSVAGDRRAAFFWSIKPSEYESIREAGFSAWRESVLSFWPEIAPFVDQIDGFDDLSLAVYGHHTLRKMVDARLVHLGDSAHSTSPQLGHGGEYGIARRCCTVLCAANE